jgi:SPX domain protein involved in polyphosphate accumulation
MESFNIVVILITLIIIIGYFVSINLSQTKKNNRFLETTCKNGICYDNLQKCTSNNAYIYVEGSSNDNKIERKTMKCVLDLKDKYKLLKLDQIFVPSMMHGTFCDILYTTYYDYDDFTVLKNRIYNLNLPISKCIRIRRYQFNPNIYFEIKYPGGTKIRAQIDNQFNILDSNSIDEENKEFVISILDKIKENKIKPIFNNTYKRLSFIYKNNPNIRMTIDTNIEFSQNHLYNKMDNDILEMKIPESISMGESNQYLKEINNLIGTNLKFTHFSKFEYYYYNVILKQ